MTYKRMSAILCVTSMIYNICESLSRLDSTDVFIYAQTKENSYNFSKSCEIEKS